MAEYDIDIPGKGSFTVSAETDEQANAAINDLIGGNHKSFSGFVKNIGSDAKDMATGMGSALKEGAFDMPKRALETGLEMAAGRDYSDTPSGHRDAELVEQAPDALKEIARPVTHPIDYGYDHPVQQALNVLPFVGGAAKNIAKYAGQAGEKAMGRLHHMSPAQFKQQAAGHLENPAFSQAMRDSYEAGDANLLQGSIGRKENISNRIEELGSDIGKIRQEGSAAGPVKTADQMADALHDASGKQFQPGGVNFQQQGEFNQQIENLRKMQNTTPAAFAERATAINKAESKGLTQPKNVETEIANKMSQINNEDLATRLSPEKMAELKLKSQKFGSAKSLVPAEIRGEGTELRQTKTPNTAFGFAKEALHTIAGGPKLEAQGLFGAESAFKNIAKNGGAYAVGGVTAHLINTLSTDPQSLGKYATPLLKAAQEGGNQALAATHYLLSTQYPEYNEMVNPK